MILFSDQIRESDSLLFADKAVDQIIDLQRGRPLVTLIGSMYHVIGGILRYRVEKHNTVIDCDVFDLVFENGIVTRLIPV